MLVAKVERPNGAPARAIAIGDNEKYLSRIDHEFWFSIQKGLNSLRWLHNT